MWDLGDPNSLLIDELSLGMNACDLTDLHWQTEATGSLQTLPIGNFQVYQESSGGEHWDSPNHTNRENRVPMQMRGYQACWEQGNETGLRASPVVYLGRAESRIGFSIRKFWQNFPKALSLNGKTLRLELFPSKFPEPIELQPGESKTHEFYLGFGQNAGYAQKALEPLAVTISPEWLRDCLVLNAGNAEEPIGAITAMIGEGLTGETNFAVKRELIDEYGWRNFGDLYADHESDLLGKDEILISHYNNQYDPIFGFLYQYWSSGRYEWFELADDLARHVIDIDLYRTDMDRPEFNGGLFWHTDHYLDAMTATHRTYSRLQLEKTYKTHSGGGGPGAEHCYTTGLLFHHLLTGSESSRRAIFELCDWITRIFEGSDTILGLVVMLRNRNHGLKNILSRSYSPNRGCGNYVNTLLDKYYLTGEAEILEHAGFVIRHTVHPGDEIASLELDDAENNWFYTVFLQSLCKYLKVKEEMDALDDDFYHARDSLLHYADWMVENESPYLDKPEILEYPNHTWTAQDIRKVAILYFACYFSPDSAVRYRQKGDRILNYVVRSLAQEPTRSYTRILSILMQNVGSLIEASRSPGRDFQPPRDHGSPNTPSVLLAAQNLLVEVSRIVRHFSLRGELAWLNKRLRLSRRKTRV
jgi:hypothetical protein